ncbi:hypothetical protein L8106_02137 [Lyngbya sp. PCC 8106]|nr:hypothetical protein L8106_02137 [Lyngbya sp. PCC 8106]
MLWKVDYFFKGIDGYKLVSIPLRGILLWKEGLVTVKFYPEKDSSFNPLAGNLALERGFKKETLIELK